MTDNGIGIILIFLQEVVGSRECNLIDVFIYFFCRQADTTIDTVIVSLPKDTCTVKSPSSPLNSPIEASVLSFWVASTALETNSRRKISWSLYKNFLITGKIFSVVTPIFPFAY